MLEPGVSGASRRSGLLGSEGRPVLSSANVVTVLLEKLVTKSQWETAPAAVAVTLPAAAGALCDPLAGVEPLAGADPLAGAEPLPLPLPLPEPLAGAEPLAGVELGGVAVLGGVDPLEPLDPLDPLAGVVPLAGVDPLEPLAAVAPGAVPPVAGVADAVVAEDVAGSGVPAVLWLSMAAL
jgi:hypothetical protein